jgi:hypothetical protein
MGFSTPAWISQIPAAPTENAIDAGNKGALAGYQLGQLKATRGALQGLDINDPASTGAAINSLVRAGSMDQATALMNLNFIRDIRSRVPGIFDQLSHLGTTQTSQPPAPSDQAAPTMDQPASADGTMTADHVQHIADTMSQGVDTLKSIRALPAEQRPAAFAAARDNFVQRGIPEPAIDAIGQDLSDAGLDAHIAYLGAHGDHFAMQAAGATPSQPPTTAHPTGFEWAKQLETSPQMQLGIAVLKTAGIDLSGLSDTAKALVMPEVQKAADAAYAGPIAEATTAATNVANANPATAPPPFKGAVRDANGNWTMQPGTSAGLTAESGATALGTEAGGVGGRVLHDAEGKPVVVPVEGAAGTAAGFKGATAQAEASGTAAGSAPSKLITITMPDGSTVAGTWTKGAGGKWGFTPASDQGGVGHAPSPQQAQLYADSAKQYQTDRQAAATYQASIVPLKNVYDTLRAGNVTIGPGSMALNQARSFVQTNLPFLKGAVNANQVQIADMDTLRKYMVQIANNRASQFGQGTNEKLAEAAHGSPNPDMSNLGALEVTRMNLALARAEAAKVANYHGAPEGYSDYAQQYGRRVDPRAFMLDLLTPAERGAVLKSITTDADKAAFLRGRDEAIKAGYYTLRDIPR